MQEDSPWVQMKSPLMAQGYTLWLQAALFETTQALLPRMIWEVPHDSSLRLSSLEEVVAAQYLWILLLLQMLLLRIF